MRKTKRIDPIWVRKLTPEEKEECKARYPQAEYEVARAFIVAFGLSLGFVARTQTFGTRAPTLIVRLLECSFNPWDFVEVVVV
jgi:hypothetical protein